MLDDKSSMAPRVGAVAVRRAHKPYVLFALILLVFYSLWRWDPRRAGWREPIGREEPRTGKGSNELVALEAHIMSKCPDAKDCLRDMVLPAMQRVHDKVNFTLSFIGTPTENDGVDCRHGPPECMGNILELCAFDLYPDPKISLGFTMCLTRDYPSIPERTLVEDCALEHAIDFKALNDCAARDNGAYGMGLLRDSVMRTSDAGVSKSCTVRLDDKIYCVRDDAEWKDCPKGPGVEELVSSIEALYVSV